MDILTFLGSSERYATIKVHLQALGLEIEKNFVSLEGQENTLRQWYYGKFKLRVLAGMLNTTPLEYGLMIQSPNGYPLVSKIFQSDYDIILRFFEHEKVGTAWQSPNAASFMDALFMMHQMGQLGDAYVREHILPNLGLKL
jgi:hypothetical protein